MTENASIMLCVPIQYDVLPHCQQVAFHSDNCYVHANTIVVFNSQQKCTRAIPPNARASHGIAHQIACTNNAAQRAPFSSAPASFRRVGGQIGGALSFFLVRAFICAIARGYRDTHTRMAPPPTLAGLIYVTAFLRQPDWLAGQFGSA